MDDGDGEVYEKYADELIRFATVLAGPSNARDVLADAVLRVFTELAPMAPAPEELRSRGRPRRRPRRNRMWLALVAIVPIVGLVVTIASNDQDHSTNVASGAAGPAPTEVRLEDLIVTYVPPGFTLEDDRTESIPSSIVPDPQGPGRGTPQGSAGTMRTQRYNRGGVLDRRAVVYVTALLKPDRVQTVRELEALVPNAQATTVAGKPAVIGMPEPGAAGLQVRWVESPHVVVMLSARGPVAADEVMRMAEGIRFGLVGTQAAPGPATGVERSGRGPGEVRVLAADATQTAGLARRTLEFLRGEGYATLDPVDAVRLASSSFVHFRSGFEPEARTLARLLTIDEASLDPSPAPVADTRDADVVLVLGQDFVNRTLPTESLPTTTAPDTPLRRLQSSAIRPDGFGPMFVGMPLEDARRLYGEGQRMEDPPPCSYLAYRDGSATVVLTGSNGDRFDLVTVTGGVFMTDVAGVRIGSSVTDLGRAYGERDLHGRVASVNGVPSPDVRTLVYLPPTQPSYAVAFELHQGIVVAIRAGSRDRVVAAAPC
ncbi:MAG TPA: LytR C-terminal domain-containing protein [Egibacteraceae bacterium]|jgi:hypothetical protein|nr:LytR C-terminal domain-containing protein [Egibacteraceae bacterium]